MTYFTSWDANVFLCLVTLGISDDVVKKMVMTAKRVHEGFVEDKTRDWYCEISPSLLYKKHKLGKWHFSVLARTPNKDVISEFKLAWQWRCPEVRRDLIVRSIIFQNIQDIERLKYDFDPFNGRCRIDSDDEKPKKGRYHSSEGLWNVWSSWDYFMNRDDDWEEESEDELTMEYDNENTWDRYRRQHIADWYRNIHEGRYFLFFRENSLTGYGKRKSKDINISEKVKRFGTIHSIGPYEQMAEDLLVLDGPGLGKKGSKIDHIDDLF